MPLDESTAGFQKIYALPKLARGQARDKEQEKFPATPLQGLTFFKSGVYLSFSLR
jgi:hypothetical protein